MVPWIQVYSNITSHDKTYSLAEALNIPNYAAVGLMVSLWTWVAVNATDGDITSFPQRAITDATGWKKSPVAFYKTLIDIRLIEKIGDRMVIRNWEQYAALLKDMADRNKEQSKDRMRRMRERNKGVISANGYVTNTQSYDPTRPDHNQTITEPLLSAVDDEARVREAQNAMMDYLENRDLVPNRYFGFARETGAYAEQLAKEIYAQFSLKPPTNQDISCVFRYAHKSIAPENPSDYAAWRIEYPKDRVDLLIYAFEQAARNGTPGNWNYIAGVMKRLHQRGIKTVEQAEDFDDNRR